ncbi:MAG: hypothetical protein WD894_11260 [Pirellulales bacterium]
MQDRIDISDAFVMVEDLPRPRWDIIFDYADRVETADEDHLWTDIARQWLERLAIALGDKYGIVESANFLVLLDTTDSGDRVVAPFAEGCRHALRKTLGGVAEFPGPGKTVLLALDNIRTYYSYVAPFHPEGQFGGSAGMQIREGYPHVVMYGMPQFFLPTLAHEMMHASLCHLTLPLWLEEGLAQMFEHDMTGRDLLAVTSEIARKQKTYWRKNGLDHFWSGKGFTRPGKIQELSYQLAEILMRLIVEEHRPRWFGIRRARQERFVAFLREASAADCGESAANEHLGKGLGDLAATFLGPGDWSPRLVVSDDDASAVTPPAKTQTSPACSP